jgi:hypothetical protein
MSCPTGNFSILNNVINIEFIKKFINRTIFVTFEAIFFFAVIQHSSEVLCD